MEKKKEKWIAIVVEVKEIYTMQFHYPATHTLQIYIERQLIHRIILSQILIN